jgi:protein-tyrosine phosphatase
MAEGLLRKMLSDEGIEDVDVVSAGIGTLDGYPATAFAVAAAEEKGIDISGHHSTKMTRQLAQEVDLILAMADEHYEFITELGVEYDKLFMLKAFPEPNRADFLHSVKDPIGGTMEEYRRTINELERELRRILPAIKDRIGAAGK